jgi:hypothetical protein
MAKIVPCEGKRWSGLLRPPIVPGNRLDRQRANVAREAERKAQRARFAVKLAREVAKKVVMERGACRLGSVATAASRSSVMLYLP